MDQIHKLLEKSGCRPELTASILESLEKFKTDTQRKYESDYNQKIDEAKKICIEESAAFQRDLARRVQIWCESKSAQIDSTLTKQHAVNESTAVSKLKNVQSLLEGLPINADTAAVADLKKQLEESQARCQKVIAENVRTNQVAQKALSGYRRLIAEKRQATASTSTTISEDRTNSTSTTVGATTTRIDGGRSNSNPATTARATLLESQLPTRRVASTRPAPQATGSFTIQDIAERMPAL